MTPFIPLADAPSQSEPGVDDPRLDHSDLGLRDVAASDVRHDNDDYEESHLDMLARMQERHFWYRGRHRFLLGALDRYLPRCGLDPTRASALDVGGGCGGWLRDLRAARPGWFPRLALGDSAPQALRYAAGVVGPDVELRQIDLRRLPWRDEWDAVFLLDTLEHIKDDAAALAELRAAVKPGGVAFVTTPALESFRTWNDELVHHHRRYSVADYRRLAKETGWELVDARYFMFFLAPLALASRFSRPALERMTEAERGRLLEKSHRVPFGPLNALLRGVFSLETPLGFWTRFPAGMSVLAVLRRPL
jgi:SAM-dependent methyltransferase